MSALLDDNLLFAGIARTGIARAELVDLVELTRDLADVRIEADRITLTADDSASVLADPTGLERIFGNLVDNGLRYGAHVHVSSAKATGCCGASTTMAPGCPPGSCHNSGTPMPGSIRHATVGPAAPAWAWPS